MTDLLEIIIEGCWFAVRLGLHVFAYAHWQPAARGGRVLAGCRENLSPAGVIAPHDAMLDQNVHLWQAVGRLVGQLCSDGHERGGHFRAPAPGVEIGEHFFLFFHHSTFDIPSQHS